MFKRLSRLIGIVEDYRNQVEYNMEPYMKVLDQINQFKLDSCQDFQLKEMSLELKKTARSGIATYELLVPAFALAREAARRVLGMYPFDVQVMAGVALYYRRLVEMQTGEGKTLAAVLPAYLMGLTGQGVHVLTFNDYLACRDAKWMGPVYEFMGLTVGYVREGMSVTERKQAYASDITYVTAKEAGFDYLRDFLCMEKENLVHRPFHFAIVDEADSILIDEARVPLVIAGDMLFAREDSLPLAEVVRGLQYGVDYETDQYGKNVSLTDAGLWRVEEILEVGNLYDSENLQTLCRLNCALHAEVLLKRDRDYVVREGRIELVDEYTGRIADKRHWPDDLQAAVEAKEGLNCVSKGKVLGSIALQHFLSLYPGISGMTGTARTSAAELYEFYRLPVAVIPTHKPCIRKDYPDQIFTHQEAKEKALLTEIRRGHQTGQPILIGTASVAESERLAEKLREAGIECQVLNAKNDEMEAKIIARAGVLGAITVSTNMAGRGIDIRLGGVNEEERDRVVALGGLYVIGTNRHESRRIDNQLRGRAGRQGDPGESRFFISLEDEMIKKYEIAKLIPAKHYPPNQSGPLEEAMVRNAVVNGQKIVEGYNSDARRQLWRYTFIIEEQRRIIHKKRSDVLHDNTALELFSARAPERYRALFDLVGPEALKKAEKQLTLYFINKCWAEYLDYIAYIREGIHLVVIGRKNPLDEFHRAAIEGFADLVGRIDEEIINAFNTVKITPDGIDMDKEGLKGPSSTWTYLINESPSQFSNLPHIIRASANYIKGTLFSVKSLYERFKNR